MNTVPQSITPELAAWLRLQMTIAAARTVEPLQREIESQESFVNCLFVVMVRTLAQLLIDNSAL